VHIDLSAELTLQVKNEQSSNLKISANVYNGDVTGITYTSYIAQVLAVMLMPSVGSVFANNQDNSTGML
jgi:hypothetical protein